ncbi:monocarboxylate permease [Pyrenophora seminiperda CCB06]|uniref:Monocarboxylate permease n=1 Tax=Pyrenophora seminiperda CCB06 TaxID=1302712 RepID=A0A3M7MDU6_9PLEO|nr:monocarboxylate permease [Pyrenophora seminiperda CCB06]
MAASQRPSAETVVHLKQAYHVYRHTEDLDRKGVFFSPDCMQICRPIPSYAATTRQKIVQYLRDVQQGDIPVTKRASPSSTKTSDGLNAQRQIAESENSAKDRSLYTIRPLSPSEFEFGSNEITTAIGLTVEQLKQKAIDEQWVGMRVDLWGEGTKSGLLVKVQYWWRFEEIADGERVMDEKQAMGWRQCLHDIMYLGPEDGTQGVETTEVNE